MLELNREIDPPSTPKGKISEFIGQLIETGRPIVLTIDGKVELIVEGKTSFQKLLELAERAEDLEILRQSFAEMEAGLGRPIEEMFAEMRQIHAKKPVR